MKRKNLLLRLCAVGFASYIVFSLVSLQMDISAKQTQLAQLELQWEEQRIENKETERLLGLGDDETYLARIAREKLDMGLADEHVYRDAVGP